ncbi:hypothetical protein PR048_006161 [Dryococelus australis]|uniref:Uncharacterized protein n=1 Tax=Dryococelus australis TaxID=614101 RepID=A0ABQ9IA77_9NEOP|nr:hypothetical protein PR048_006161 [Dryococelus australis]
MGLCYWSSASRMTRKAGGRYHGPKRGNGCGDRKILNYFPSIVTNFTGRMSLTCSSGVVVRLLASRLGEPGSIPGGVTPDFHMWESCRTMPLVDEFFLWSLPFLSPMHLGAAPYSHLSNLIGSQDLDVKSVQICSLTHSTVTLK